MPSIYYTGPYPDSADVWKHRHEPLSEETRHEDAIAVYDDVVARFAQTPTPGVQEQVATALVNKGYRLKVLGRSEDAIAVCDEVVTRYGTREEAVLAEQVARALLTKGVTLGSLGQAEAEIAVYEEVVTRYGTREEAVLAEWVARVLVNKGVTLGSLGQAEAAIAVYEEVVTRYGTREEAVLAKWVARALVNKGFGLGSLGQAEAAIAVYEEVVTRYGTREEAVLAKWVARALVNKGFGLGSLGQAEAAIAVYDEVVARFEQTPTPGVQGQVAMALVNKGLTLEARGDHDKAIEACIEALAHDPTEAIAAAAYYNRASALFALHRWDDAFQVLDDALARFPQDHDRREAMSADASLRLLLTSTDTRLWPERIAALLACYAKHGVLTSLGQGLVRGIATLYSCMTSNTAAQTWWDIWQERAGGYDEFTIPLRLLDAAVSYRETHDQRVLLRLPMEERKVLEQILGEGSPETT